MHGGWNHEYDLDDAGFANEMKKKLILGFWAIGSSGAVIFACFFVFLAISYHRLNVGLLTMIAIGIYAAWGGFTMFLEEKRKSRTRN